MNRNYHGVNRHRSYFEGWYLKHQTKQGDALALIPALHIDAAGRRSASVQVIAGHKTWWLDYPDTEFQASQGEFQLRLAQNRFGERGIRLDVERAGLSLHGAVGYGAFTPLRSDIMGPFRFLPGMECSHGVVSMGHPLDGVLVLNGRTMDFSGGLGYVETDRGRSFPSAYLWTQCIWERDGGGSLMLSIATIPMAAGSFTGCICAVLHGGWEYRLATYRGARVERWSAAGAVIRQGKYRLAVELLEGRGDPLWAPVEGSMGRTIRESLCAKLRYRFWEGDALVLDHIDRRASFEYADERSGHGQSAAV